MEKTTKKAQLFFIHPVDKAINENGGRYGDPRHGNRTHKGIDYLAPKGTNVKASASGIVVKSENKFYVPGGDNNYGETIVIDHTPFTGDKGRHIYTLYAHLDERFVSTGKRVSEGETIGSSGNSGMKAAYEGKKSGFHLHFEVIDSEMKMRWETGWLRENRKNPIGYLRVLTTVEYESLDDKETGTGMGFPKGWF